MTRLLLTVIVLTCLPSLFQSAAHAQRPQVRWNAPPEEWHWNIPEQIPGMIHGTVASKSMNREVGFNIYLPPGYDTSDAANPNNSRYPVVYYLHGASGSELSAYELGDVVRRLVDSGKIDEVIYVFPNGGHFSRYRDWDDANVKAETFIIKELIPHIDRTYRTITSRKGRALCGWSMGGDASLRFACKYPDMFCAAATMSAAIDWGADADDADTIFAHSKKHAKILASQTGFMMVVGEDDRLYAAHQRLLPHFDQLDIKYDFASHPDVGHNLGTIKQKSGEDIVLMLARHYAPPTGRTTP
jgi:endo-1,4-beta-xylanase